MRVCKVGRGGAKSRRRFGETLVPQRRDRSVKIPLTICEITTIHPQASAAVSRDADAGATALVLMASEYGDRTANWGLHPARREDL